MRKIPTLFVRDPDDRAHVLDQVTPGCEWVMAGEGVATRKYDGTCCLIRRDGMVIHAFARREVKAGRTQPPGFIAEDTDEVTGKTQGWVPMAESGFNMFFAEAVMQQPAIVPGTYELCGPKINGNPEGFEKHTLVSHADAQRVEPSLDGWDFAMLRQGVLSLAEDGWEGVVWHHPDGRMAKLKARDFA